MSKYPERCTAVVLRLNEESDFELYAPYGLEDILNFQVSSNSSFLENETEWNSIKHVYPRKIGRRNGKI